MGLALIAFVATARAGEPARLRGSNVADLGAANPGFPADPYYAGYGVPPRYGPASTPARPLKPPPSLLSGVSFEVGTRIWYSSGSLAKDLFSDPRATNTVLNSRLTYSGLTAATFEGYGRAELPFGSFIKGYAGFSGLSTGALSDEDFPPGTVPYSDTRSDQHGGRLAYGVVDLGQTLTRYERASAGLFVGFGYLNESVSAFGCTQLDGNPFICMPAISSATLAITQNTQWQFIRLGVQGEVKLLDCLKLGGEIAWLPYEQLSGTDTHWLRLGSTPFSLSGPIPEVGGGTGVQIEALMSYQVTDRLALGLGGRYWYLQTRGSADLENMIVDFPVAAMSQTLNFTTIRYGGFAQASYRLGPL